MPMVIVRPTKDSNSDCPICLGETGETAWTTTTTSACFELSCGHSACRVCLRKWLEQSEENGQEATCFECRQAMQVMEIRCILKRELQLRPKKPETTIDSLTLDWMNAHDIKQCPWCGIWIEKVGGCDYMRCWCRKGFYFECGCCDDLGSCYTTIDDDIAALNQLIEELEAGWLEDRMIGFDDEFIWEGCKSKLIQRRRTVRKKKKRSRAAQEEWRRRRFKDMSGRQDPKEKFGRRRSPRKESRWVVDRSEM